MIDAVIEELRFKAKMWEESPMVSVYCGDLVVKADAFGHDHLREDLITAVAKLESSIPEDKTDFHPGSDDKVVNLVHPSICPLIYGRTRICPVEDIGYDSINILQLSGKGEPAPTPPESDATPVLPPGYRKSNWIQWSRISHQDVTAVPFSRRFQWLPCDVRRMDDGIWRISSYINNLHPEDHWELYECINRVINRAIPVWEKTLTPLRTQRWYTRIGTQNWKYEAVPTGDAVPADLPTEHVHETRYAHRPPRGAGWKWRTVQPDADRFYANSFNNQWENQVYLDNHSSLQIIVKLANIELTPLKPRYDGGTWHVEGQLVSAVIPIPLIRIVNGWVSPFI
jgi:hypothetical protein